MQISDSHESVTRDASARREAMVGQLRQLVERLNVAPGAAVPPAAVEVDTVRISPEARRAMNSLSAPGQPPGGASPGQVIAAIRAVLLAASPDAAAAATARLAELVRTIVTTFPARTATSLRGYPIDDHAANLVRALLPPAGGAAPEAPAIAAFVRSLFAGHAGADAPPEAALQRAALAIFLASTRAAYDSAPDAAALPDLALPAAPRELPAALLGHLAQVTPGRRDDPVRRRERDHHDEDGQEGEPGADANEEQPGSEDPDQRSGT